MINKHASLVGYVGQCRVCSSERRVYKAAATKFLKKAFGLIPKNGKAALNGRNIWNNCVNCVAKYGLKYTVSYRRKLSQYEVLKDFDVMLLGVQLAPKKDFKSHVFFKEKEAKEFADFEKKSEEFQDYLRKKNPMAQ